MEKRELKVGEVFGYLMLLDTATKEVKANEKRYRISSWICRCKCGKLTNVPETKLRRKITMSCGCRIREVNSFLHTIHGESRAVGGNPTKEFSAWSSMIERCYNENNHNFNDYGGRGISVCKEWKESYEKFLSDVGRAPSNKHSLNRINNDGNYEPKNVDWATHSQQARNRRGNRMITYQGKTLCISEWAERTGISKRTLRERLERSWTTEEALEVPVSGSGFKISSRR